VGESHGSPVERVEALDASIGQGPRDLAAHPGIGARHIDPGRPGAKLRSGKGHRLRELRRSGQECEEYLGPGCRLSHRRPLATRLLDCRALL